MNSTRFSHRNFFKQTTSFESRAGRAETSGRITRGAARTALSRLVEPLRQAGFETSLLDYVAEGTPVALRFSQGCLVGFAHWDGRSYGWNIQSVEPGSFRAESNFVGVYGREAEPLSTVSAVIASRAL